MIAQNASTGRNTSSIGYVCQKPYVIFPEQIKEWTNTES